MKTARATGAQGSAIYCMFTELEKGNIRSSTTSAGHDSLILMRRSKVGAYEHFDLPNLNGQARGPILGGPDVPFALTADHQNLVKGDVIIGYTDGAGSEKALSRDEIRQLVTAGLEEEPPRSLQVIADNVLAKALKRQPPDLRDDATVILIRVRG